MPPPRSRWTCFALPVPPVSTPTRSARRAHGAHRPRRSGPPPDLASHGLEACLPAPTACCAPGRPGCRRPPAATLPLCRLRRRGGPELQHLRPIEREIRVALFDRADRLLVQRPTADVDVGRGAKQVKNSGSGLPSSAERVHDGRCLVSTRIAGKSKEGHLARVGMTSIPPTSVSARDEPYAHPPEAWPISGPPISIAAPLPIAFSPGLNGAAAEAAVRRDAPS